MKILPIFVLVFCFACSSANPLPDVIEAKTTTRDAKEGEVFEKPADVGNQAHTEKQKNFVAGQKAYEIQAFAETIEFLTPVVNSDSVDEMNYFATPLLLDSLANEKRFDTLCTQVHESAIKLCGPKSEVKPDQLEICKDVYDIRSSCSK